MGLCTTVVLRNLGRMSYGEALRIQKETVLEAIHSQSSNAKSIKDTLFLVEHNPVYTVGIRNNKYPEEIVARLRSLGADFVKTDRGGLITFHGYGQLVAYPILYLGNFNKHKSMKWYVERLEQCLIKVCRHFGVQANVSYHIPKLTGVWVNDKKIAAIGVHGTRYVTSHGVAINCNTDLQWFSYIDPCGIPDKGVTSLSAELGRDITIADAIEPFIESFENAFQCKIVPHK